MKLFPNTLLIHFQSSCACQTEKTIFDNQFIDKKRVQELVFSYFWTDSSSYHYCALTIAIFYSSFNFKIVTDENMYRDMIYLADFHNLFFSLLFDIQGVF